MAPGRCSGTLQCVRVRMRQVASNGQRGLWDPGGSACTAGHVRWHEPLGAVRAALLLPACADWPGPARVGVHAPHLPHLECKTQLRGTYS